MQGSNDFVNIILKGNEKYVCLMSPEKILIKVNPENGFLLYQNLDDLYKKFGNRIKILRVSQAKIPLLISEDIFEKFSKKNLSILTLYNKFNCSLL